MISTKIKFLGAALVAATFAPTLAAAGLTLDTVRERGFLKCQVGTPSPGSYELTPAGDWKGLDVDVCRAVAAAIFGDPDKVEYTSVTSAVRFTTLSSGETDMLSRTTTWTMSRDTQLGISFAGVNHYDGQGFLVHKSLGVNSALDMKGATICVLTGTTSEKNLADFSEQHGLELKTKVFDDDPVLNDTYLKGGCDAMTTDKSYMAGLSTTFPNPSEHMILPETLSKEPLGPAVRKGDDEWFDIVRWSLNVLIAAEEFGITQANVDDMRANPPSGEVARMLGVEDELNTGLALDADWAYNIIKGVGNYGEIYKRSFGEDGIGVQRAGTPNALWSEGGLMYAPPFR